MKNNLRECCLERTLVKIRDAGKNRETFYGAAEAAGRDGDTELFAAAGNQQFLSGRLGKDETFTFKLNHFALSSNLNGNTIGPANIRENVILDSHGATYSGTFSIDQYDTSGNLLAHIVGK